jgi:hypothetical protein
MGVLLSVVGTAWERGRATRGKGNMDDKDTTG